MKRDKQQSSFVNIGSASLLIIFLIVSLAAFAVLSLVSAYSDYKLTSQLAEHKREYYEASAEAEQVLAKLDELLEEEAEAAGGNIDTYKEVVVDKLKKENYKVSLSENKLPVIDFSLPISEKQELEVRLSINDYIQADTYYNVEAWQVKSTEKWEGDQTIELLPMGE